MSTTKKKKTTSAKKTAAKKKSAAKKKPAPKVNKIEIDVPSQDEVKDLVADTLAEIKANDFKLTPAVKKGFLSRITAWFKVS